MMELLQTAVNCGVKPSEFWRMTPAMVSTEIDGYFNRLRREQDDRVYFAWLHGAYNRAAYHAKRYPKAPEPTRDKQKQAQKMTEDQMKAVMRGLSARGQVKI